VTVSFDSAHRAVAERLSEAAAEHSLRVAKAAVDLAHIYGVDTEAAAVAGVLHDWHREVDADTLLALADTAGLAVSEADRVDPRLLHARLGALEVSTWFPGIDESIVRAVETHTLGAVRMSELDMVVYIADMIEPSRTFKGVDDLREAVGSLSLDELFAEAYRHSVMHVVRARKPLHPLTTDVWNAHCVRGRP
jgi:predicted HD superfamily hydrolase involved in NAD metabolism